MTIEGILFSLSNFSPYSVRLYKWGYSWGEIKNLYIQKQKESADKTNNFCTFIVDLVSAIYGGKKSEDEIGLDDGSGADELTEEQIANMIEQLGQKGFYDIFPSLKPEE